MANDKKISAKEVAVAVLKKAEQMIKKSALAKAPHETAVSAPDGIQHQVQPSNDPRVAERDNNASTAAGEVSRGGILKGPIKLAKFVGRMEHKRSQKAAVPAPEAAAPATAPAAAPAAAPKAE